MSFNISKARRLLSGRPSRLEQSLQISESGFRVQSIEMRTVQNISDSKLEFSHSRVLCGFGEQEETNKIRLGVAHSSSRNRPGETGVSNLGAQHSFRQVGSTRGLLEARPGASTVRAAAAAAQNWREARPNAPPLSLLHNNPRRGGSSLRVDLQRPPAQPTSEISHPP